MNIDPGIAARKHGRHDSDMVDIDLEGGKGQRFGPPPRVSAEEMERLREEEKMSLAGIEQRSPRLISPRTPSPLSRNGSLDSGSGLNGLQRPAPTASPSDSTIRRHGTLEEDRDTPVVRTRDPMSRAERDNRVVSVSSQAGLLDAGSNQPSRASSPVSDRGQMPSPSLIISPPGSVNTGQLEDAMEEVSLDNATPSKTGGLREVVV